MTKLLFFATLLIFMNSCADDDMASADDTLAGDWTAISFSADINVSTEVGGAIVESSNAIVGSNLDYDLTLTGSSFTTSGGYDIQVTTVAGGLELPVTNDSYSNVSGNGTYTSDETTITFNGSLFDFEYNGVNTTSLGEEQTSNYSINAAGNLIISQNETMETNSSGIVSTTTIVSASEWTRQ